MQKVYIFSREARPSSLSLLKFKKIVFFFKLFVFIVSRYLGENILCANIISLFWHPFKNKYSIFDSFECLDLWNTCVSYMWIPKY